MADVTEIVVEYWAKTPYQSEGGWQVYDPENNEPKLKWDTLWPSLKAAVANGVSYYLPFEARRTVLDQFAEEHTSTLDTEEASRYIIEHQPQLGIKIKLVEHNFTTTSSYISTDGRAVSSPPRT